MKHRKKVRGKNSMKSKVYFSKKISSKTVLDLYNMVGKELKGNIAIKVHSGEEGIKIT